MKNRQTVLKTKLFAFLEYSFSYPIISVLNENKDCEAIKTFSCWKNNPKIVLHAFIRYKRPIIRI